MKDLKFIQCGFMKFTMKKEIAIEIMIIRQSEAISATPDVNELVRQNFV